MRKSDINISVALDTNNVPDQITWSATDNPTGGTQQTKAFALSIFEEETGSVLQINLWDKDFMVHEMKIFMIQTIGGLGETLFNATQDAEMKAELDALCAKWSDRLVEEQKAGKL